MIALQKWFDAEGRIVDLGTRVHEGFDGLQFDGLHQALVEILATTAKSACEAIVKAGAVTKDMNPLMSASVVYNIKAKRIDITLDIMYPCVTWNGNHHVLFQKTCRMWDGFPLEPDVRFLLGLEAIEKYGLPYLENLFDKYTMARQSGDQFVIDVFLGER